VWISWIAELILADPFWETDSKEQLEVILASVLKGGGGDGVADFDRNSFIHAFV